MQCRGGWGWDRQRDGRDNANGTDTWGCSCTRRTLRVGAESIAMFAVPAAQGCDAPSVKHAPSAAQTSIILLTNDAQCNRMAVPMCSPDRLYNGRAHCTAIGGHLLVMECSCKLFADGVGLNDGCWLLAADGIRGPLTAHRRGVPAESARRRIILRRGRGRRGPGWVSW